MGFEIDDEFMKQFFKEKSPKKRREMAGLGNDPNIALKFRVAEWIDKVWELLKPGDLIAEERLCTELGVKKITKHVRDLLAKRGVRLQKLERGLWKNKSWTYYEVMKA